MVSDKWTHGCRGVLSPLPDLWAAQWDGRQLEPLKDYLDLSQACWDNLGAKSLCLFHINLQGGGWHMGKEQSITHCVCDRECVCCGMCLWLVNIPPLRHKFSSILQQFSALDDTFRFWYQTTAHHLFFIKDAEWFNLEVWSVYKQICISFFFFFFFFSPSLTREKMWESLTEGQMLDESRGTDGQESRAHEGLCVEAAWLRSGDRRARRVAFNLPQKTDWPSCFIKQQVSLLVKLFPWWIYAFMSKLSFLR